MYYWNINTLAKELGDGRISEKTSMLYYLASSLLILFSTYYSLWWGVVRDWLFYFELFVLSIITIVGCIKAFESNGGNEGKAFVLRAVCLSVPIGIRVTILSILFGLGMYFMSANLFTRTTFADPQRAYSIISYVGFVGFNIYFWWLLVYGFKTIRNHEQTT
ncbi:MAG: hypothetical protein OEY66_12755 [Gammaproteobacteria bacterium]|nr:hypothetical protein [Gammaproteobacteria bacterium]